MKSLPAADRILVIRLGAVGDVVRTLPAVSMLRRAAATAQIVWLVEPAARSAVEGQPWVDDVVLFPRPQIRRALAGLRLGRAARLIAGVARQLRQPGFDLVVDFHAILKSGVLARLSGAAVRASYAAPFSREGAAWFATHRARLSQSHTSRFARNEALVRFLGVDAPVAAQPFVVPDTARAWARDALAAGQREGRFAVLHPGTSAHTPHKRWTVEGFARLSQTLSVPSLVSYGPEPGERASADALVAAARGSARLAPETRSLSELAALTEAAQLYVGADSGPLHIASLVGTPVVQLLGPTDPVENAPYPATPHRSVRVPVACSSCRKGCDAAPCMQRIDVERVRSAAEALLAFSSS